MAVDIDAILAKGAPAAPTGPRVPHVQATKPMSDKDLGLANESIRHARAFRELQDNGGFDNGIPHEAYDAVLKDYEEVTSKQRATEAGGMAAGIAKHLPWTTDNIDALEAKAAKAKSNGDANAQELSDSVYSARKAWRLVQATLEDPATGKLSSSHRPQDLIFPSNASDGTRKDVREFWSNRLGELSANLPPSAAAQKNELRMRASRVAGENGVPVGVLAPEPDPNNPPPRTPMPPATGVDPTLNFNKPAPPAPKPLPPQIEAAVPPILAHPGIAALAQTPAPAAAAPAPPGGPDPSVVDFYTKQRMRQFPGHLGPQGATMPGQETTNPIMAMAKHGIASMGFGQAKRLFDPEELAKEQRDWPTLTRGASDTGAMVDPARMALSRIPGANSAVGAFALGGIEGASRAQAAGAQGSDIALGAGAGAVLNLAGHGVSHIAEGAPGRNPILGTNKLSSVPVSENLSGPATEARADELRHLVGQDPVAAKILLSPMSTSASEGGLVSLRKDVAAKRDQLFDTLSGGYKGDLESPLSKQTKRSVQEIVASIHGGDFEGSTIAQEKLLDGLPLEMRRPVHDYLDFERIAASYKTNISKGHGGLPNAGAMASGNATPGQIAGYVGVGAGEGPMRFKRHLMAAGVGAVKAPFKVVDRALANLAFAAKQKDATYMQKLGLQLMKLNVAPAVINEVIQQNISPTPSNTNAPTPG